MQSGTFIREVLKLMYDLAQTTEGTPTRCRRLALELYNLADRLDPSQRNLAKRLRIGARRLGRFEPATHVAPIPEGNGASLSPRHARILRHLLAGESEKTIAAKLGLSRHTVHEYVKTIYRRLGVGSRAELAARGRTIASHSAREAVPV